jgi:hypothetical protein
MKFDCSERMRRYLIIVIWFVVVIITIECACGGGSQTPPPPPKSPVPTPTVLRTLYRVVVTGTDRTTTIGPNERSSYPMEAQVYYVPDQGASDRTTLNRVVNSDGSDHADTVTTLSGYSQDMELGFPWSTNSIPGVAQLTESFNSTIRDYALLAPSESLAGYVPQPLAAYGYPRFGNAAEVLLSTTAGGVTVQSNAVAGGSTWRWFWNGTQFLNHGDYGREIQGAFYFGTSQLNPDEAGDFMTMRTLDQSLKHGSPVLRFENQGNTQYTRAILLNWDPRQYGGDQDHPVIWDSLVLGKDLALNYQNLGPVAQYTTHLVLPSATTGTLADPAGYLLSSFNRFWTYDALAKVLTEVTNAMPNGCLAGPNDFGGYAFFVDFGGIIMSDASGANAMGIYGVSASRGGSVSNLDMWKFDCWGDGPSETASDNTAWSAAYGNGTDVLFPAGESTYNVYLITDTLQNVTARMDDLFQMGAR